MAEWLGRGLQNLVHRFNSGPGLKRSLRSKLGKILTVVELVIAVILILVILMQNKGVGLTAAFGGEGGIYRSKRGIEKGLFVLTIILAIVFVVLAIVQLVV